LCYNGIRNTLINVHADTRHISALDVHIATFLNESTASAEGMNTAVVATASRNLKLMTNLATVSGAKKHHTDKPTEGNKFVDVKHGVITVIRVATTVPVPVIGTHGT